MAGKSISYDEHKDWLVRQVQGFAGLMDQGDLGVAAVAELSGFVDAEHYDVPLQRYNDARWQRRYMLGFETGRMKLAQDAIHAEYGVTR